MYAWLPYYAGFSEAFGAGLNPEHVVVSVLRDATGDPSLDQLGERAGHWITQGLQQAAIPLTPWDQGLQSWTYVQTESEAGRVRDPIRALAEATTPGASTKVRLTCRDPCLPAHFGFRGKAYHGWAM